MSNLNLYYQLLQKRCSILKEVVAKGRPKLTFEQPKVKLPDHPEIQQFLRNVQQTFVYQNFSNRNRNQARHWADKYSNKQFGSYLSDKYSEQKKREYCCDAEPSGAGKNACVIFTKNPKEKDNFAEISNGDDNDEANPIKKI